jgi:hypothetical protein
MYLQSDSKSDKECAFNPDTLAKYKSDSNRICPAEFLTNENDNCFRSDPYPSDQLDISAKSRLLTAMP